MRALFAPDLNAERQCEDKDKYQCHRHHQLSYHIVHQTQRVFHTVSRPQHNRQQRQSQAQQSAAAGPADFRINTEVRDGDPFRFHNPVTPLKQHPEECQLAGDSPHQRGIRAAGFQTEIPESNHKQRGRQGFDQHQPQRHRGVDLTVFFRRPTLVLISASLVSIFLVPKRSSSAIISSGTVIKRESTKPLIRLCSDQFRSSDVSSCLTAPKD